MFRKQESLLKQLDSSVVNPILLTAHADFILASVIQFCEA